MRIIQAHIYLRTFIEYIKGNIIPKFQPFLRDINSLLLYKNIVQKCTTNEGNIHIRIRTKYFNM